MAKYHVYAEFKYVVDTEIEAESEDEAYSLSADIEAEYYDDLDYKITLIQE